MKHILSIVCFIIFIFTLLFIFSPTYSFGYTSSISGSKGSRVIKFYEVENNEELSYDTLVKYFGLTRYYKETENNEEIYFYNGKEIDYNTYINGYYDELATNRKNDLGLIAYRTKTTQEVIKTIDYLYNNYFIGTYYIEYSPYDNINWDTVNSYIKENYELDNYKQNFYSYKIKGIFEPYRFDSILSKTENEYEYKIDTTNIRMTKNEADVANNFINNLIPYLNGDGSTYSKILAAYTYITNTTTYLSDEDYVYNMLKSNTSIYSVFINRKSVCIGYSIAFSYLMDKMGIESYIVDNITYVSNETKEEYSSHTYNIVKLDNKWFIIDTTGGIFLGGLNKNTLYKELDNISYTDYKTDKSKTITLDYNKINVLLNNAKNIKTTTTKYIRTTTTIPEYTTNKKTNKKNTTTIKENTSTKISDTSAFTTSESKEYITYNYSQENDAKIDTKQNQNNSNKLIINIILILLGISALTLLIVYKIKNKKLQKLEKVGFKYGHKN